MRNTYKLITVRQTSAASASIEDMDIVESASVVQVTQTADWNVGGLADAIHKVFTGQSLTCDASEIQESLSSDILDSDNYGDILRLVFDVVEDKDSIEMESRKVVAKAPNITPEDKVASQMKSHKNYIVKKVYQAEPELGRALNIIYRKSADYLEMRWNKRRGAYMPHRVGIEVKRYKVVTDGDDVREVYTSERQTFGVNAQGLPKLASVNTETYWKSINSEVLESMRHHLSHRGITRIALGTEGAHIVTSGKA